jgi:hypothetical protein
MPLGKGVDDDRGRGDSGSAPDVPREPGSEPPTPRGGGEWGLNWVAMITLSEVGQQIAALVKNITLQIIEVLSPILTTIGVVMIIFGAIALSAGREWLGYRLLIGGGMLLVTVHFVVPMLLQFI